MQLVAAYKERLARFVSDFLEHVAMQEAMSPQQKLMEDLLAIVHTFSRRLDGLRRYEEELKRADLAAEDDR